MKTFELKNKKAVLIWSDTQLIFQNLTTDNLTVLEGREEFILYLEKDGKIKTLPSSLFTIKNAKREANSIILDYASCCLDVSVIYQATDDTFIKSVNLTAKEQVNVKRLTLETRTVSRSCNGGGEGMPVFVDNEMWMGIEFPAAQNYLMNNSVFFSQSPFELCTQFNSLPVVYGFNGCGDLIKDFEAYVSSFSPKKSPLRIYCDWGLHDDMSEDPVILTEELVYNNLDNLAELTEKSGTKFDYYLMDAFWFEENNPYVNFKKQTFPKGIDRFVNKLDSLGMKFGLWFDINFIHAHMKDWEKYSTEYGNGASCFAVPEVARLMTEAIEHHVRENKVKMIKLDFAYFECKNPSHGHSVERLESKEQSIKNFIKMVDHLHAVLPELKILCYNGWTTDLDWIGSVKEKSGYAISPYWCKHVDYLYCGDPRPSEISSADLSNSIVYYTDAMIRNFRHSHIPFNMIDDHGTMLGNTGTIYYLEKATYRCSLLMNVLRGGAKMHLYGDNSYLDQDDFNYYSLISSVYDKAMQGEYKSSFILGNAAKGEVYGYSLSGATHGYAVVLNPTKNATPVTVTLNEWKDTRVEVAKVIVDGQPVNEAKTCVLGGFSVNVSANGYVLIEWERSIGNAAPSLVTVCPNEVITLCVEGKKAVSLTFKDFEGRPIRTPFGYPEGLTVTCDGNPVQSVNDRAIWSGVSWLYFAVNGGKHVEVEYKGQAPLMIEYQLEEDGR